MNVDLLSCMPCSLYSVYSVSLKGLRVRECVLEAFYYDRQCVLYQTVFFIQVGLKRWYLVLYAVCG